MYRIFLTAAFSLALTLPLGAVNLKFAGYAGNSGTEERPVLFGPKLRGDGHGNQTQSGPCFDPETGKLYLSARSDRINAYSLDGRLEASYPIPKGYFQISGDPLVRCGGNLYFRRGKRLWELPLNAPDGTKAIPAKGKTGRIRLISSSSRNGRIAVLQEDGTLSLYNPADGKAEVTGSLGKLAPTCMDWNSDGNFFAVCGKVVHKIVDGKSVTDGEWPKKIIDRGHPVFSGRFTGGAFFGGSWNSTLIRLNEKTMELDPGVVFGGKGGHILGYLFSDREIGTAGGIAGVLPGIYAVGGSSGVTVLMKWNAQSRQLERIRRIGALPDCPVLELDGTGTILAGGVGFNWNDPENAPILTSYDLEPQTAVRVGLNEVVIAGTQAGQFAVLAGSFQEKGKRPVIRTDKFGKFPNLVGAAVRNNRRRLLLLNTDGSMKQFDLFFNLHTISLKPLDDPKLETASPVKAFSSSAQLDDETLAVAADGEILVLKADGADWKEVSRWEHKFEPGCRIAADGGKICIAEKGKNLVSLYSVDGGKLLAKLSVSAPGAVALNGGKLAVHDTKNQRINKYILED